MVQQFGAIYLKKNILKIFILQDFHFHFQEHTTPIFKNFKILKLQGIIKFNTLKLIYLYSLTRIIQEVESYFLYHKLIQLIIV